MESEEVRKIREQYLSGLWPKFLEMISIDGLRGWSGQSIIVKNLTKNTTITPKEFGYPCLSKTQ